MPMSIDTCEYYQLKKRPVKRIENPTVELCNHVIDHYVLTKYSSDFASNEVWRAFLSHTCFILSKVLCETKLIKIHSISVFPWKVESYEGYHCGSYPLKRPSFPSILPKLHAAELSQNLFRARADVRVRRSYLHPRLVSSYQSFFWIAVPFRLQPIRLAFDF